MKNFFLAIFLLFSFVASPASGVYNGFMADMPLGTVDWDTDSLKVGLLDTSHTFTAADDTWADVSANEVSATGYTAGGNVLDNCTVTEGDPVKLDCDDEVWTITGSMTAYHAVIYDTTNADSLMSSFDFGGAKTSTDDTFTIQWNVSGVNTIAD